MSGIRRGRLILLIFTVAALAAAVFALLYYSGMFLPAWAAWHEKNIEIQDTANGGKYEIVLKKRKLRVYKNGECEFESPLGCKVQNVLYTDIDRDGEDELILLNFNIGRYGAHKPFWVKHNKAKWFQHIYIYDHIKEEGRFRPIWMASDISMEAADFELEEKQVIKMTDRYGNITRWMWISFGLRCVD
ncbi:MAG: hypothetical protein K6E98_10615 [Lachnospiraceae bacterium]|nr:hypothetical protein [Lachnospiraceae bacterium]